MADNRIFTLLIIAATLSAAAASPGQLCCTSTGNCPGQGVCGASVHLNCIVDGHVRTFSQTTTDSAGSFDISLPPSMEDYICGAVVNLPVEDAAGCRDLSAADKGILIGHFNPDGSLMAFKKFSRI